MSLVRSFKPMGSGWRQFGLMWPPEMGDEIVADKIKEMRQTANWERVKELVAVKTREGYVLYYKP